MGYDPKKAAEKQVRRASAATQDYIDGINAVKEAPTQRAKKKKEKMRVNFLKALDSGKFDEGCDSVTLEGWQSKAGGKGAERYAGGVADSQDKIEDFHEDFAKHVDSVQSKIDSMPDTTPEERINRMVTNARELAKFKRKRKRR